MKKVIHIALMVLLCAFQTALAQENDQVEKLEEQKQNIKTIEKEKLKTEIQSIEKRLKKGKISNQRAEKLKEEAADKHARNIENKLTIIDQSIELIERNPEEGWETYTSFDFMDEKPKDSTSTDSLPIDKTSEHLFFGLGLQNVVGDNLSLFDTPYKNWGSRYFEVGFEFATTLDNSGFVRLLYGASFQFNGLKPKNEQRFYENGDQTFLAETNVDNVDKSKFRLDNFVVPIHLEIGPTDLSVVNSERKYQTNNHFRLGVGGFVGLNMRTVQKLKYENNGQDFKTKISDDFNTNPVVYGLSAYIGAEGTTVYARYNLNALFDDQQFDQNMVSIGLRFISPGLE